jgi:hypothetical protein
VIVGRTPRNRQHYHLTNTRFSTSRFAPLHPQVLRGGHAACILVERVEKPTDNGSARLLC